MERRTSFVKRLHGDSAAPQRVLGLETEGSLPLGTAAGS